jgi:hypothetical protein
LLVCSSCAFLFILEHYKQANTKGHTKRERKTWRMTRQCWAESGWLLLLGLLAFLPTPPPPHWTFCDVHCVLHDGRRPFCLYVVCVSSLDQHPLTPIIFLNDFNMWEITKFRTNYVGEVGFEIKIRARENLNFFLSFQTIFENNSNYIEFI